MRSFLVCFLYASKAALNIESKLEREVAMAWVNDMIISADGKESSGRAEGTMGRVYR